MMNTDIKYSTLIEDLTELIEIGGLIPIIGDEVLLIKDDKGQEVKLMEYVFNHLANKWLKDDEYPHLTYSLKNMTTIEKKIIEQGGELIREIKNLFRDTTIRLEERAYIRDYLMNFLTAGKFPLILTTSCSNILDSILKNMEYGSVYYDRENRRNQDIGEINEDDDYERLKYRTIFHLFGSYSAGHKNVITEKDFLQYLHCLHDSNSHPEKLLQYVSKRKILSLGCDIPDWTFRFFLYSLKDDVFECIPSVNGFNGGVIESKKDRDLADFLFNIKYYYEDAGLESFLCDLNRSMHQDTLTTKKSVFLSVISSDIETNSKFIKDIQELKNYIKSNLMKDVWFCKDNLEGNSGEQYWNKIKEGLANCSYFIPVITPTLLLKFSRLEINTSEPMPDKELGIITEWKYAIAEKEKRGYQMKFSLPYMIGCDIDDVKGVFNSIETPEIRALILGEEGYGLQLTDSLNNLSLE